jgi:hypothetical protein
MSLIASSAGCFSGPDFCLIFAPCGYDDPENPPYVKTPPCLKGADAGQRTIKGPALLIAQLSSDRSPFNSLPGIAKWAASLGYKGLQLPSSDTRFLDLRRCAESQTYADEITGVLKEHGLAVTELVTALQGQLVAVHPAYDTICDAFAPSSVQGNPKARQAWAVEEMKIGAVASRRLGLKVAQTFSGSCVAAAPDRLHDLCGPCVNRHRRRIDQIVRRRNRLFRATAALCHACQALDRSVDCLILRAARNPCSRLER